MKKTIKILCWVLILASGLYLLLLDSQNESFWLQGEPNHELSLFGESPQLWWFFISLLVPAIVLALMRARTVDKKKVWNSIH